MSVSVGYVSIDCQDAQQLCIFWSKVFGLQVEEFAPDEYVLREVPGLGSAGLLFIKTPDAKVTKNRLHLDLQPIDQEAEVARLKAMGAVEIEIGQSESQRTSWVVLADPEGNEFCVLA